MLYFLLFNQILPKGDNMMFATMKKSISLLIVCMLIGSMFPIHETKAATVSTTTSNPKTVEGTTDRPNQPVTIVANEKVIKLVSDANSTYTHTFEEPLVGKVAVYQRETNGFDQLIRVIEREVVTPSNPVTPIDATLLGLINNEFVFVTHPTHTIHATYEGRVKEAKGELRIPKNTSETVSVYVSSPEKASTPIKTYQASQSPAELTLDAPPHETLRVSGTTLPYAEVHVKIGYFEVRTGRADAKGKFDFPFTGWESRAYEKQTYTVQLSHFVDKSITDGKTFEMPAFQPTAENPLLVIKESFTQLTGITVPGATIELDGEYCTTSYDNGYFDCDYELNDQSIRTFTITKNKETLFTKEVKVKRDIRTISFEKTSFDLEEAKLIAKATPNQTFVLTYQDPRAGYAQVRFRETSDADGNIVFDLPKLYGVSFMVNYVDEYNYSNNPLLEVRAEDNRIIPKPNIKLESNRLVLSLPSFHYPGQTISFETKVEKANGQSLVEKTPLTNPIVPLEVNDRFMTRTVLSDGRVSDWVEGTFDAIQQPIIEKLTNHSKVLKGTTEPGAILQFSKGITKDITADGTGRFEFPVNVEKTNSFELLVKVTGKADQRFSYTIEDSMVPILQVYEVLSDTSKQIDVHANEYVKDFTVAYYKGTTLLREGVVKPNLVSPVHSSGYTKFAQLPVSNLLTDGVTHLVIKAKDRAGNWSEGNKVTVKDITRPKLTQQKHVLPGEHVIYGKTEPGAKVTFTYRSDKEKVVSVSKTGDFVIKTTDPIYFTKNGVSYGHVKITSMDAAGNRTFAYVAPVGEKIQDIRLDGGQYIWFYSPLDHMDQRQYTFTVNGKTYNPNEMGSVVTWANDITLPAKVTVKLINPDKTVKYELTKTVTKPYEGKNVSNVKFQNASRHITGKGEAHALVEVWSGASKLGQTVIDGTGTFKLSMIRAYKEGETLQFVTYHKLGQKTSVSLKAKDNTAPAKPTVNEVSAVTTKITGKTDKGATVLIAYNGRTYTTKANNSGVYAYTIKKWTPGKTVSVRAKDAFGNVSSASTQTIKYVMKPLVVKPLRATHTSVTGTGHPGATIQVYKGSSEVGKAVKVDTKGNFKVYVNKQRAGSTLKVEMTRAGYATKRVNVVVTK